MTNNTATYCTDIDLINTMIATVSKWVANYDNDCDRDGDEWIQSPEMLKVRRDSAIRKLRYLKAERALAEAAAAL